MKIEKRCFLQWFVLTLTYGVGAFFAWHYGLPQTIFATDMTYMTSVIAAMSVLAIGYLGFASWRFDGQWHRFKDSTAYADTGIGNFFASAVIYVGLIGTVIGLMTQLKGLGGINPADPASATTFLGLTAKALGTAFYATGCGLVAALGIHGATHNLSYFLDRSEVAE